MRFLKIIYIIHTCGYCTNAKFNFVFKCKLCTMYNTCFFMAKQISLDSKGQRVNTIFGLPLYPKPMDKKEQERENLVTILELLKRLAQQ